LRPLYVTDGEQYAVQDSGCHYMTVRLGKPSRCLDCPMKECRFVILDNKRQKGELNVRNSVDKDFSRVI